MKKHFLSLVAIASVAGNYVGAMEIKIFEKSKQPSHKSRAESAALKKDISKRTTVHPRATDNSKYAANKLIMGGVPTLQQTPGQIAFLYQWVVKRKKGFFEQDPDLVKDMTALYNKYKTYKKDKMISFSGPEKRVIKNVRNYLNSYMYKTYRQNKHASMSHASPATAGGAPKYSLFADGIGPVV